MIETADGFDHLDEIRVLFDEYTAMLVSLDPSFQKYLDLQHYDQEARDPSGKYSPPDGRLIIIFKDGLSAGCAALRKLDESRCELKRLYVRPEFRNNGLAHVLLDKIIAEAKAIGYRYMLLDTLPQLENALRLYEKYGFRKTECYNDSPVETTIFMALDLKDEKDA